MVNKKIKHIVLLLLLFAVQGSFAQGHLFSEVKINRSSIYVGQPVQVTVGIFTSTWYTKGVSPGNVKVNGAFTVFFRSLPTSKNVNDKNYAGVELIYNVFPYDDENIIFPSLEFSVETPDEGGYKGITRKVKTKERNIKVKPIPKGYEKEEWLVAYGMSVNDNWDGDMKEVKVGDVLVRTISREVSGTVAELVPPIQWDTLAGVSLYPSRSSVNSNKTKTSISASRTDGVRYLFEKEGSITIPEKVLTWWNPDRNKLYKKTLPAFTIVVLPNPDLGMLESVRDSLAVSTAPPQEATGKSFWDKLLERFSLQQLILVVLILLILIRLVYKIVKWTFVTKQLVKLIKSKRRKYLQSEKYYFKQFRTAAIKKDVQVTTQKLYLWIGKIHLDEPSVHYFVTTYGNEELLNELNTFYKISEADEKKHYHFKIRNWSKARKKYLRSKDKKKTKDAGLWINP